MSFHVHGIAIKKGLAKQRCILRFARPFIIFCVSLRLEREVVFRIRRREVYRSCRSRTGCGWERWLGRRLRLSSIYAFYLPSTDTVKPASLPLPGIYIERNIQLFSQLNIELLYLICSKHIEAHAAWILVVCFQHILLHSPLIAVLRRSSSRFKHRDYFS